MVKSAVLKHGARHGAVVGTNSPRKGPQITGVPMETPQLITGKFEIWQISVDSAGYLMITDDF
jgi:hypothetical protein